MISRRCRVILLGVLGAGTLVTTGCQQALFMERDTRTQFETYDRMRQRYVPSDVPDVFGNPKPALRARLTRAQ